MKIGNKIDSVNLKKENSLFEVEKETKSEIYPSVFSLFYYYSFKKINLFYYYY